MKKSLKKSRRLPVAGFSYVELVVALSISAIVLTAAVMAYGTITGMSVVSIRNEIIRLPAAAQFNFYSLTNNDISVPRAPNYGTLAQAEALKERLYQDVSSAAAVFLLGRDGLNTVRSQSNAVSGDVRTNMTPAGFRALLPNAADFSATATNVIQTTNSSLYILNASSSTNQLSIRCIYETDFVSITSPPGIYASVRRYDGSTLTDYYHVFYPQTNNTFRPLGYVFNRTSANITVQKPFSLAWWPDPSVPRLPNTIGSGSSARTGYTNMANHTSFFFALPMFPPL